MHKIFTEILFCGILPALGQQISRARDLGIFEIQSCLGCHLRDRPGNITETWDFHVLSRILGMCTGQDFFQALCTRTIESALLGRLYGVRERYVFVLEFWKRLL
jgi:hypothetical protein